MYSDAYILYLVHFHGDRDYFECHEILEEYWKHTSADKQSIWVGFILMAVSNYHYRRGNNNGALKTLKKAITIFKKHLTAGKQLGVELDVLISLLTNRCHSIQSYLPYTSFDIPFSDQSLSIRCQEICKELGFIWGSASDTDRIDLINRHSLRDRGAVLQERKAAIEERRKKRQ